MSSTVLTRDALRSELAFEATHTEDDVLLDVLVGQVNAWLGQTLGRKLDQATHTHAVDGNGLRKLLLPEWPISSVTSVKEAADGRFDLATAFQTDTYRIGRSGRFLIRDDGRWSCGAENFQVVYVAGYASGSIPPDLEMLARHVGAVMYRKISARQHGETNRSVEGVSVNFSVFELPPLFQQIVRAHTRTMMGVAA